MSASVAPAAAPLPGTYWVDTGTLLAGAYPGHVDPALASARLGLLLELGVDWFIDLTWPGELPAYDVLLPSAYARGLRPPVAYSRRPIRDHGLPAAPAQMLEILDEIDAALAGGHRLYVHCRAGIGRTGTVIGCLLARRGGDGRRALVELDRMWCAAGRDRDWPRTPETEPQLEYVRDWREGLALPSARGAAPADGAVAAGSKARAASEAGAGAEISELVLADRMQDRYRGLLLGLALGDALGAPAQHRRAGSFPPVGDLIGGGPYDLPRGAWTDDTALPLLLADSLLATGRFDARDFVQRCQRWQREGYLSSTGQCLGITATTARALAQAQWRGKPFAGSHDPARAEKEPLLRAGVAVAFALADPAEAIALAAEVARPTHQAPVALDACRYYAALLIGALQGEPKTRLLEPNYTPVPGLWERRPLKREVAAIAAGSWRTEAGVTGNQPGDGGGGTALDGLVVTLRALARGTGYRDTVLPAVNLGEDADTNGALAGQLAGALYGARGLPPHWLGGLVAADLVTRSADRLLEAALQRIAAG